ncbi:hypothetical protein BJY52DRAFT_1394853 [Lactarius psammicola]|nr:hypothetical protein BJY52DRAFT_1394853 [Lactarius psammicola]
MGSWRLTPTCRGTRSLHLYWTPPVSDQGTAPPLIVKAFLDPLLTCIFQCPAERKARKPDGASHPYSEPEVKVGQARGVETPLEGFFSQYSNFQSQPSNSPVVEFDRLCRTYDWERNDPERKAAREAFQFAMKMEFDDLYGSDENDIENWHKLCYVLRIDPAPDTLRQCRAVNVSIL